MRRNATGGTALSWQPGARGAEPHVMARGVVHDGSCRQLSPEEVPMDWVGLHLMVNHFPIILVMAGTTGTP